MRLLDLGAAAVEAEVAACELQMMAHEPEAASREPELMQPEFEVVQHQLQVTWLLGATPRKPAGEPRGLRQATAKSWSTPLRNSHAEPVSRSCVAPVHRRRRLL